jgi:hypothetical protein
MIDVPEIIPVCIFAYLTESIARANVSLFGTQHAYDTPGISPKKSVLLDLTP